ncbi:lysophospholipase [Maribacter sp. 2308TA10-17]|uniref:alpha/beta hydrolase n=1 Tax=Maribacter sp. 2308TA10-17 TaxID=3386276 RepID=UPI0039BD5556
MKEVEFRFHLHGCEVYGFQAIPNSVKGVVILVHGFGEHSGRYKNTVIPMLVSADLAVLTYDNVGHGKSSGRRGHCPSYEALLDILREVIEKAEARFPNLPVFLYGHSMGGNLVLNYVLKREVKLTGIVATSPYLRLAFKPPKWKIFIGRRLKGSAITLPSGLDPSGISRIPEEVEKYKNDPLVHDKVSPMFSFPVMDAGEWAIQNANQLKVDTLLLHGTADQIIDPEGTKAFHQNSAKTTLELFEGGYHELHNDSCKVEMLQTISNWLQQQLV